MSSEQDDFTAALLTGATATAALIRHTRNDLRLLASILEHTHMLVAYLDTHFDFVRVNRAYAGADGRTEEYFTGKNHFDLYPNEENVAIFRRVLDSGEPYFAHAKAFEYADHPERGVSYWDWSLVPTKTDSGTVTGLVLTLADVTQIVETRESLRRERDLADSLVRTARAIILVLDVHGNIVRFNPYLEELTGYRLEDVIGKSWFETFIPAEESMAVRTLFSVAISGVETCGNINTILAKDGGRRIIQWFDTTLHDAKGGVSGLLAVGIDNTRMLSSQQDLKLFKAIVRSSSEAIAIADEYGHILFVNEAHQALYGYSEHEVLGRNCLQGFIEPDSVPEGLGERIREGDCARWEGEASARDSRGRRFPVWMRLDCTCDEDSGSRHYILLAHDITAQKHSEQQRLEEEKHRHEMFIREIHHRIKNHLQGVIGLLRNCLAENAVVPAGFNDLVGKISALAGVYDIGARHLGPALPLVEVVRSVIATQRDLHGPACRILSEFSAGDAWLVSEESVPVALVLSELMTNACKHRSSTDGLVRVMLHRDGQEAVLTIVNAGVLPAGFCYEERTCIGMGLSLIHSLLPRHSAALSIEQSGSEVAARLVVTQPLLVLTG